MPESRTTQAGQRMYGEILKGAEVDGMYGEILKGAEVDGMYGEILKGAEVDGNGEDEEREIE